MRMFLMLALMAGCGDSQPQINITKSIGAEGGMVSAGDGTTVTVPMGALSGSTNISITPVTVTPPPGTVLVGPAYDFQPEGTTFTSPVSIVLPFDQSKIPSGLTNKDIVIYTAPRGSTNYQMLFTSVGSDGKTVTTATMHFSTYLPATPAAACMPVCTGATADNQSCTCTSTCDGMALMIACSSSPGVSTPTCFCEINHQTTGSFSIKSCSDISTAFSSCTAG